MSLELSVELPVVKQWKSGVNFGGNSGKAVVMPMISIVLYQWITAVIPPSFTNGFHWVYHQYTTDILLVIPLKFHWYTTGNTTNIPLVYGW